MKTLTWGQKTVLAAATLPMIGAGGLGAWGTYANITSVFHRSATALGVVAAGEGATLVLALVLVGLTMLGQPSPLAVRVGLWLLPAAASVVGVLVAPGVKDAVVFAITPMAMTVSAEGLGLLARRIVVHTTGVDVEAQRRNAATLRRIAYHRARAVRHPKEWVQKRSDLKAWRLMSHVGEGDAQLGAGLVEVQRERLTEGADTALASMLGSVPALPELPPASREPGDEPVSPAPVSREPVSPAHEPDPGAEPESSFGDHAEAAIQITLPSPPLALPAEPSAQSAPHEPSHEPAPQTPRTDSPAPGESTLAMLRAFSQDTPEPVSVQADPPPQPAPAPALSPDQGEADEEWAAIQAAARRVTLSHEPVSPDREPGESETDDVDQQITALAIRLRQGEHLTKTIAAQALGVSPATAGRRLKEAKSRIGDGTGQYL